MVCYDVYASSVLRPGFAGRAVLLGPSGRGPVSDIEVGEVGSELPRPQTVLLEAGDERGLLLLGSVGESHAPSIAAEGRSES